MKYALSEFDIKDHEHAARILKKSSRRGEIGSEDCSYITSSLISTTMRNHQLSSEQRSSLDDAIGVLLELSGEAQI